MPKQRHYQPEGEDDADEQVCHYCGSKFPAENIEGHEASCSENDS